MAQQIKREVHEGRVYLSAVYRGTQYTLSRGAYGWELTTKRLALGRFNFGGFRRFDTLAAVQAACKPFAGVALVEAL
jgi:hypothetical protein